jgi:hypothetical protein
MYVIVVLDMYIGVLSCALLEVFSVVHCSLLIYYLYPSSGLHFIPQHLDACMPGKLLPATVYLLLYEVSLGAQLVWLEIDFL